MRGLGKSELWNSLCEHVATRQAVAPFGVAHAAGQVAVGRRLVGLEQMRPPRVPGRFFAGFHAGSRQLDLVES